eukprot:TRINITY_DN2221_c0_g1_i2.p1 TRINITY_DN2221_c0_g1~~TRINITY_DN2221_c0_g1_i2.p1  ORF type:complete len:652 (-),score=129.99 TRINITY_DN2221_c0_g1_i2:245-2200(-)
MGCGGSVEKPPAATAPVAAANEPPKAAPAKPAASSPTATSGSNQPAVPKPGAAPAGGDTEAFTKHMNEFGLAMCTVQVGKEKNCFACAVAKDGGTLEVGCTTPNGDTFTYAFSEPELNIKRDAMKTQWPIFFKSLRNGFANSKVSTKEPTAVGGNLVLLVPLDSTAKSPPNIQFALKASPDPAALHRVFLGPLIAFVGKRKSMGKEDERFQRIEAQLNARKASCADSQQKIGKLQTELIPLTRNSKQAQDDARAAKEQCEGIAKRISKLKNPSQSNRDHLYPAGPSKYPLHIVHASEHIPQQLKVETNILQLVKQRYGADTSKAIDSSHQAHAQVLQLLSKIDDWDYDVFQLHEQTTGSSLFLTCYTLLYKYGLVQHYNMNEEVLINFLTALESGYHPVFYHNSVHAADVLQVTHFIMEKGGLRKALVMSPEDCLAAIIAAAIHDFDHPGFNNNFHCRTNSYLAILYNDRSVLENHHLAQVFDLMKTPSFDIFKSLTDDQRKDVRETMTEMVLSTDMGNHAKIFQTFRKRMSEAPDWHLKRDDQRLALSIAIKMADISNSCRPQALYVQWAKRIAQEFYTQGDAEAKLKFSISPFMDRRKHNTDFPKGQISFMNYIVSPLFEAGAQLLPGLEFTLQKNSREQRILAKQTRR